MYMTRFILYLYPNFDHFLVVSTYPKFLVINLPILDIHTESKQLSVKFLLCFSEMLLSYFLWNFILGFLYLFFFFFPLYRIDNENHQAPLTMNWINQLCQELANQGITLPER